MDKKVFIKNRPFDVNDANDMQNWHETGLKNTMKSIYSSGVVSGLSVTNTTGLGLLINAGTAFDSNYNFINVSANQSITLSAANTNPRYDKIVISYVSNTTNNVDTGNIYGMGTSLIYSQNILDSYQIQIIQGTPATSPTVPTTPSGTLPLAQVYIAANATSVSSSNITDLRSYITLSSNINKPVLIKSSTAPTDTTVLWIDTTVNKPKIYVGSSWIVLNSEDANTLDGHDSSYFSPTTHNHDTVYAKIGDAYTKTQSDANYPTKANNLSDLSNITTARTNLGLGSAAIQNTTAFAPAVHNHDGVYVKGDYVLTVSSTAPTPNGTKDVWWDVTNNLIKRYNGTSWVVLNAGDAQTISGKSVGNGANNVLLLDSAGKVPSANLDLVDSYTSTSITSPATANSAKMAYDNAVSTINSQKGVVNGIASLGADGKVPSSQLNVTNPPDATTTTKGITMLTDSISSTNTTSAATPNSVKQAYDLANGKYSKPGTGIPKTDLETAVQTSLGKADSAIQSIPTGSTGQAGIIQLTDSTSSTSITTAATPNSVKTAYDKASSAIMKAGDIVTGKIDYNTNTSARLIIPVGTNRYAT